MNAELTKVLYKKYPKIFQDKNASLKQSLMAFGCDCGDGWYRILDALCAAITNPYSGGRTVIVSGQTTNECFAFDFPQVIATQIKEKYGRLVFYYRIETSKKFEKQAKTYPSTAQSIIDECCNYIDGAIRMAETMSEITCEECGEPGVMTTSGYWYQTLCPKHAKERNAKPINRGNKSALQLMNGE
jgi:hypothetical protein